MSVTWKKKYSTIYKQSVGISSLVNHKEGPGHLAKREGPIKYKLSYEREKDERGGRVIIRRI